MNPRVKKVTPEPDYKLRILFTNGEEKIFDARHLLNKGVFRELRDESRFRAVRPWYGTVQWSGGQDLCPDTLYEDSAPVEPVLTAHEPRSDYQVRQPKTAKHKPRVS